VSTELLPSNGCCYLAMGLHVTVRVFSSAVEVLVSKFDNVYRASFGALSNAPAS
jgi:hypothetical protein